MDDMFENIINLKALLANDSYTLTVIVVLFLSLLLIFYGIPRLVFFLYEKDTIPQVQSLVTGMIYKLDETADLLSNSEKRDKVAKLIHEKAKFKDIAIPLFMCGWVVDFLVKRIRDEQAACSKDSDLHH